MPFPTNAAIELAHLAIDALGKIYKEGYGYKKAGVIVMDLSNGKCKATNDFRKF